MIAYSNETGDGYDDVTVDSSPQIMRLETERGDRSVVPGDPALAFIDMLLEDLGDEWVTKMMYHYRWAYDPNIDKAQQGYDFITHRQIDQRALVGSTEWNTPLIEDSYRRVLAYRQQKTTNSRVRRTLSSSHSSTRRRQLRAQTRRLLPI